MNNDLYYDLVKFLGDGSIRKDSDEWRRKLLENARRTFEIDDENRLFHLSDNICRTVIPRSKLQNILLLAHNHPLAGHMGRDATIFRLQQEFWWPNMTQEIADYVKKCDKCQKRYKEKDQSEASLAHITSAPFQHIRIDVMGPLLRTITR